MSTGLGDGDGVGFGDASVAPPGPGDAHADTVNARSTMAGRRRTIAPEDRQQWAVPCPSMRTMVAALIAVALTSLAAVARHAGAEGLPPAPPRPLSYLTVGPASGPSKLPQIVDQYGRVVLLKGVNADGLVDYFRDGPVGNGPVAPHLAASYPIDPAAYRGGCAGIHDDKQVEGVPLCEADLAQMRPLGYNVIRLNLSWSLLEPEPGTVNPGTAGRTYMDRIQQVVDWAAAQGIYVLLDMHEDAWSKYVYSTPDDHCPSQLHFEDVRGYDGAPAWASTHLAPACAVNGVRELDSAVAEDFQKFWSNLAGPDGVPLQDHYAAVVSALAKRFAGQPAVAGYELMNEPEPGYLPAPLGQEAAELFPFYAHVIDRVRRDNPGFRQLVFIEPDALRNVTDQSAMLLPWSLFSSYVSVVYAPHVYTGVFTLDSVALGAHIFPTNGGYDSSIMDARNLGLPLWIGEFGDSPSQDDTILRHHYELQDQDEVGGTIWLWKENANDVIGNTQWGVYHGDFTQSLAGIPTPSRIKYTARAFPLLTAGTLDSFTYNPENHTFDMRATTATAVTIGDRLHATLLFVPALATCQPIAENASIEVFDRGGQSREIYAYPRAGAYRVTCQGSTTPPSPGPVAPAGGGLPNTSW